MSLLNRRCCFRHFLYIFNQAGRSAVLFPAKYNNLSSLRNCKSVIVILAKQNVNCYIITRQRSWSSPSIGNTLWRVWTTFRRSAITLPEVNVFGWNLGHSEYIVWSWLWQILGAIRAEARAGARTDFCFFLSGVTVWVLCNVSDNRFPFQKEIFSYIQKIKLEFIVQSITRVSY